MPGVCKRVECRILCHILPVCRLSYLRMKFNTLFLCTLFAAAACHSLQPQTTPRHLTVLTYNIRYDNPDDGPDRWELRRNALAAEVAARKPAIIGFQEVLANQLAFLESRLGTYRRIGVGRDDGASKGEFSPIFFDTTLFQLVSGQTFWLSTSPGVPGKAWDAALPRIATMAVLQDKCSGEHLWVLNTHFDHVGKTARLHSAELIMETLGPALKNGKPVLFMGDLNTEPGEPPIAVIQRYLTDACPPAQSGTGTFNGFELSKTSAQRIDYVWYSAANWRVVQYAVPQPKIQGRQVSDHFPVVVQLQQI